MDWFPEKSVNVPGNSNYSLADFQQNAKTSGSVFEALVWILAACPYWSGSDATAAKVHRLLAQLQDAPHFCAVVARTICLSQTPEWTDLTFAAVPVVEPMRPGKSQIDPSELHHVLADVVDEEKSQDYHMAEDYFAVDKFVRRMICLITTQEDRKTMHHRAVLALLIFLFVVSNRPLLDSARLVNFVPRVREKIDELMASDTARPMIGPVFQMADAIIFGTPCVLAGVGADAVGTATSGTLTSETSETLKSDTSETSGTLTSDTSGTSDTSETSNATDDGWLSWLGSWIW